MANNNGETDNFFFYQTVSIGEHLACGQQILLPINGWYHSSHPACGEGEGGKKDKLGTTATIRHVVRGGG